MKKIISRCLLLTFLCFIPSVRAASTCDYSEQVELSGIASTVKADYAVTQKVMDMQGNVAEGVSEDDVTEDSNYFLLSRITVHLSNLTEDVYVTITNDKDMNRTFYYSDTNNGEVSFDGGDLSEVINYKITIYSNKDQCKGESLRTIDFVTPMKNSYAFYGDCEVIPNFEYCQAYITAPFMASDMEITQSISNAYQKYLNQREKEEEEQNKNFFEKLEDFYQKNKVVIYSILGVVIVIGALTTVVIVRKRRSRIL